MPLSRSTHSSAGEVERLISHILVRYHDRARFGWPAVHRAIRSLAEQVEVLQPVVDAVGGFVDQLEGHLRAEEELLFPYFIQLERWELGNSLPPRAPAFGKLSALVSVLVEEHREEERLLERIRETTNGYAASMPELASVYDVLRTLDADQSGHAFLEDTVLLPRMLRLEERLLGRT